MARRESRNGPVRVFEGPCTLEYQYPLERVVFWPERDANPFFHLMESLWMLAGRNDVEYLEKYNSKIGQFSDDGETFHGAYGYRWLQHFGVDQLATIAKALKENPDDRRQVLQMWSAEDDLGRQGKDLPCNLMAVFNRDSAGKLNMTVYNRSNDLVWGALGANCVHFSVLQEYLATAIGCPVGRYWQVSANMHAYDFNTEKVEALKDKAYPSVQARFCDPYQADRVDPFPLINTPLAQWRAELQMFLELGSGATGYRDPFFRRIALPMEAAYAAFSNRENPDRFADARGRLTSMAPSDWKLACTEWLDRREAASKNK